MGLYYVHVSKTAQIIFKERTGRAIITLPSLIVYSLTYIFCLCCSLVVYYENTGNNITSYFNIYQI